MKDKLKDKMKKKFTDLSISHKMLMVYITFASAFLLIALGLTQISFRIYSKGSMTNHFRSWIIFHKMLTVA